MKTPIAAAGLALAAAEWPPRWCPTKARIVVLTIATTAALAACGSAPAPAPQQHPPSAPSSRVSAAAAQPSQPAVPAVCAQPGGMVWVIQSQLASAMMPKDDAAIYNELISTAWPSAAFQSAAAKMAADMTNTDGPGAGINWLGPSGWNGPAMGGSPDGTSRFIQADDTALRGLCDSQ